MKPRIALLLMTLLLVLSQTCRGEFRSEVFGKLCINEGQGSCVYLVGSTGRFFWQKTVKGTKMVDLSVSRQKKDEILVRWQKLIERLNKHKQVKDCVPLWVIEIGSKRSTTCSANETEAVRRSFFMEWASAKYGTGS